MSRHAPESGAHAAQKYSQPVDFVYPQLAHSSVPLRIEEPGYQSTPTTSPTHRRVRVQ